MGAMERKQVFHSRHNEAESGLGDMVSFLRGLYYITAVSTRNSDHEGDVQGVKPFRSEDGAREEVQ